MLFIFIKHNPSANIVSLFINKNLFFNWLNINLTWIVAAFFGNVYSLRNLIYFKEGFKNSSKGLIYFILFIVFVNFLSLSDILFSKKYFIVFIIVYTFFYWAARFVFYFVKKRFNLELYSGKKVLIIGRLDTVDEIKRIFVDKKELGFVYSAYINDDTYYSNNEAFFKRLFSEIKEQNIEEIFFAGTIIKDEELYKLIQLLDKNTIRIRIVPDFFKFHTKLKNLSFLGDLPLLSLRDEPLESLFNRMLKRAFDVAFSSIVIILILSWVYPLLAILIKLESKGPVFFKQLRSGRNNQEFWCYKFRSMKINNNADILQATKGDCRITRIGSFIRKTSIDELPQFLNVFIGNMSVVGPRPHMLKHTEHYASIVDKYMIRHFVKPGITGWAQVHGYRGEISNIEEIKKRIEYDIWYIENWSLVLDIQIIPLTIYNIFKGEENAR
ncbi:MAG: undecaprenyl-phosphate glucose phosphotransferase [Bacteroidetes bacterium]|nr:undecaprenyl-phosphate glucose phosphotransferase [Bacteroidota bacterium]